MNPKIFLRVFIAFFLVSLVGVGIWGWTVVQGVRTIAHRTDTQMRTLAWASLAYAAEFGRFPLNAQELQAFGPGPESIAIAPEATDPAAAAGAWPTSRAVALKEQPPADLAESMKTVLVTFGTDAAMPPYLKPDGLPTMIGTNDEVNGWLASFRKRFQTPESAKP